MTSPETVDPPDRLRDRGGRVLCFGELLLRLAAPGRELLIQTPRLELSYGGAEANVAVGLAALGERTAVASRVPDNALGAGAIAYLRGKGVETGGITRAEGRMGLYFLALGAGPRPSSILYDREESSFARAGTGDFDWDALLEGADLLHLSGITPALGPRSAALAAEAVDAAVRRGVAVSFDGNYREQLWRRWDANPAAILRPLVQRAAILFGNHRDISLLLGKAFGGEGAERRRAAAEAAFDAFPNLQLIASTARHVADADTHRMSARIDTRDAAVPAEEAVVAGIVDRIGTGDAFAAGVLHGLRRGLDHDRIVRTGLALAVLKHSLPGDASLFGSADVEVFLAGGSDVRR